MRELNISEILWVSGGYSLDQHAYSFIVANMLTFAGISTLLSLVWGKEAIIGALLAEGIYASTIYFAPTKAFLPSKPHSRTQKGELPSIVIVNPQ